ncbi:hypothetical protein BCUE_0003 [Candidatus Kinetoplastibacterium blastocrithidii TCC012E]|uniref:Uncharacterized protein n=1 Tax=Candidatus Kinetoplastidibacterium blastocrithidiae TCC012E TaxID=1208922 RepID=M1ME49_9PROT|nr:hypothetical protein [Candidatus Kinetoplastibacterium blastocrithidii]AGF50005.1 hypothetical protein BCUE_0003 [Candidatus Kinetoplastibacterium blastocrithidii TCC012E]
MLSEIDSLIFRVNSLIDKFKDIRSENADLEDKVKKCNIEISNIKEICGKKELDIIYWKDKFIELEENFIDQAKYYDLEISRLKEAYNKQNSDVICWKNKSIESEDRIVSLISEKEAMENVLTSKLRAQEECYKEKEALMKNYEHKLRDILLSQESKISHMRSNVQSAINRLGELANKLPCIFSNEDDSNGTS